MEKHPKTIIADSSALISLTITTDSNHAAAWAYIQQLPPSQSIIVPAEVYAETLNLLGKKFGHKRAIEGMLILADFGAFIVQPSSDLVRSGALELFKSVGEDVSYTDCLVMAMAEQHGTVDIFGFDEAFSKRGYFLPPAKEKAA
jgi:predicted nucleic acid-binding protein